MGYIENRNKQKFLGLEATEEFLLPYLADGSSSQMLIIDLDGTVNAQTIPSGGGGGGGMTSFSAGNLSPLFTTTETDPTGNAVLNFFLSNAGANTYFGNATGSSAAPSYVTSGTLTSSNDTNVTLTLGGTPANALLKSISLNLGWTGSLSITRGGTGQTSANAAFNALAPSQTGNATKVLTTDGTNSSWQSIIPTAPTVTTSGATSLTLTVTGSYIKTYVFTGSSGTTWTLPAIGTTGQLLNIKNRGSANITLQRAGSDQLYDTTLINSILILPGDSFQVQDDGTYWIIM